jgi:prepilin-type N-terminal cleavage/methylation domain-containing protein
MKGQKGFTLIELMVVIVIIGILATLVLPKMIGMSKKAKASEVPTVVKSWETLQTAYVAETGAAGGDTAIGFTAPTNSKWWTYTMTATVLTATAKSDLDKKCKAGETVTSTATVSGFEVTFAHASANCMDLFPNF